MFRRYQEEMNAVIKSKNAMIEERRPFFRESPVVQTELTGEKKDVESLKAAMQSMTEKMISIQKSLDEQGSAMADLKEELEVGDSLSTKSAGGTLSQLAVQFAMCCASAETRPGERSKVYK